MALVASALPIVNNGVDEDYSSPEITPTDDHRSPLSTGPAGGNRSRATPNSGRKPVPPLLPSLLPAPTRNPRWGGTSGSTNTNNNTNPVEEELRSRRITPSNLATPSSPHRSSVSAPPPPVHSHSHGHSQSLTSPPNRLPQLTTMNTTSMHQNPYNQYSPRQQFPSFAPSPQLPQQQQQQQHFLPSPSIHFPNPQYPFIPSPHPGNYSQQQQGLNYSPFPPQSTNTAFDLQQHQQHQQQYQQQHQAMLLHQAQYQQQQWQMEMMRGQQNGLNYTADQGQSRRRATSGPATANGNQYNSSSYGSPYSSNSYPTPPASSDSYREGTNREQQRDGYHPYSRRQKGENSRQQPINSSPMSSTLSSSSNSSSAFSNVRSDSTSASSLSMTNFPPLPTKSPLPSPSFPSLLNTSPIASAPSSSRNSPGSSLKESVSYPSSLRSASPSSSSQPQHLTPPTPPPPLPRSRTASQNSVASSASSSGTSDRLRAPASASSTTSSLPPGAAGGGGGAGATKKPSPLSQTASVRNSVISSDGSERPGTVKATGGGGGRKLSSSTSRESDEESDDTALGHYRAVGSSNSAPAVVIAVAPTKDKEKAKKGFGYQLKKAFSMNNLSNGGAEFSVDGGGATDNRKGKGVMREEDEDENDEESDDESEIPTRRTHISTPSTSSSFRSNLDGSTTSTSRPPPSTSTGRRLGGLFNSKMNSSTDNISMSSTVSSASIMIRKLGQLGKLARRSSMMSLTKAFGRKDKEENEVGEETSSSNGKKKDKKKAGLAPASVAHVTAELDSTTSPALSDGMSPAAALAKRHQQQYAEQDSAAAAAVLLSAAKLRANPVASTVNHTRSQSSTPSESSMGLKSSWGRSKSTDDLTTEAAKEREKLKSRKVVTSLTSVTGTAAGGGGRKWGFGSSKVEADTARTEDRPVTMSNAAALKSMREVRDQDQQELMLLNGGDIDEFEPMSSGSPVQSTRNVRRPVKGILKGAGTYSQEDYNLARPAFPRNRANSADNPTQLGQAKRSSSPIALVSAIPSQAQVDGLAPSATATRNDVRRSIDASDAGLYANPSHNASAPTLQTFLSNHRSRATSTPTSAGRRIVFAQNLSVHTTWPAAIYDRRAEPAACNRLTPAFAQRIKEELNAFKMEEMDVHPMSRQLTHFFV